MNLKLQSIFRLIIIMGAGTLLISWLAHSDFEDKITFEGKAVYFNKDTKCLYLKNNKEEAKVIITDKTKIFDENKADFSIEEIYNDTLAKAKGVRMSSAPSMNMLLVEGDEVEVIKNGESISIKEWNECKDDWYKLNRASGNFLNWRMKINVISRFGGFFAKGYLNGDKKLPVHIIPNLDSINVDALRVGLDRGSYPVLRGKCSGCTEIGEVIFEVEKIEN